ncbi:LLM class F420-dependent oxidoreductase [Nocardia callitridis]|uniref:LLM class F420-dependent oxidoreductase n=1 Tax=Nocardia callitridis TaxID=648753 RepID=A0ABP9KWW1_9NOCA
MALNGLGQFGVWRGSYQAFSAEDARELEQLGYGTLWIGGSPPADLPGVETLLEATESIVVGTSIVNIWTAPAKQAAEAFHRIEARFPGRFLLGVGAGHPEANTDYRKPYDALVEYLDELDAAGVPKQSRALAALGPKVLKLSADRTAGALPYLTTPEHATVSREVVGPHALVASEHKVVLDTDAERARATARPRIEFYLNLRNYRANLLRLGLSEEDLVKPGSALFYDAVLAHGDAQTIAARLREYLTNGADHVAIQVVEPDEGPTLRALAPLLTGS